MDRSHPKTSHIMSFPNALVPTLVSLGRNPDRIVGIGNPQQIHLGTGPDEVMIGPPTTTNGSPRYEGDKNLPAGRQAFGGDSFEISSNRINQKFRTLRKQGKKGFIAFITAGDPSLKTTQELVLAFEQAGVDVVELGVPFSDPLADGLTIQESSQRALKNHTTLAAILKAVQNIRRHSPIPIALMTYYNPVFHFGEEKFVDNAQKAGVDGVIIPDLPPEEAGRLIQRARRKDLATIFFLSPTTTPERMRKIIKASTGFIYYISLTGVTGIRQQLPTHLFRNVKIAQKLTGRPVCVGFGISTASQVKDISKIADGVIVGSAIVQQIAKNAGRKNLVQNVSSFVKQLAAAA